MRSWVCFCEEQATGNARKPCPALPLLSLLLLVSLPVTDLHLPSGSTHHVLLQLPLVLAVGGGVARGGRGAGGDGALRSVELSEHAGECDLGVR